MIYLISESAIIFLEKIAQDLDLPFKCVKVSRQASSYNFIMVTTIPRHIESQTSKTLCRGWRRIKDENQNQLKAITIIIRAQLIAIGNPVNLLLQGAVKSVCLGPKTGS